MKLFKEFLDYIGGVRLGSYGNYKPMASLGDRGPKGQAGQNSRGVGLNATYSTRAAGSMRPMLKAQTGAYNIIRDGQVIYKTNNRQLAIKVMSKARTDEPKSKFKLAKNISLRVGEQIDEQKELEETWWNDVLADLKSKTIRRGNYKLGQEILQSVIDRKKKENGKLYHSILYYAQSIGTQIPGVDYRKLAKMVHEETELTEAVSSSQISQLESYADRLFKAVGIDVEFTKHFMSRVNDIRNKKPILLTELINLFKSFYYKHGKKVAQLGDKAQAVIKDMKSDINIPFVLNFKKGMFELVAKTVMRKKNFKSSNPKFRVEEKTPLEKYLDTKTRAEMVEGGFKDFEEDGGNNARM